MIRVVSSFLVGWSIVQILAYKKILQPLQDILRLSFYFRTYLTDVSEVLYFQESLCCAANQAASIDSQISLLETIYFLVIDCGGVSTDIAVVESKQGNFRNLAVTGNNEVYASYLKVTFRFLVNISRPLFL